MFGEMPARLFNASHMRLLMEIKEKQDMAGAANNRRKYLSVMFTWALAQTPQGAVTSAVTGANRPFRVCALRALNRKRPQR